MIRVTFKGIGVKLKGSEMKFRSGTLIEVKFGVKKEVQRSRSHLRVSGSNLRGQRGNSGQGRL